MVWLVLAFVLLVSSMLVLEIARLRRRSERPFARMRTLEEEVSWLRSYSDVLRARHGEGLRFHWAITPAAARTLFPRFVLQPLLEEAVTHGLSKGASRNEISVRAALAGERGKPKTLVCTVEDAVPAGATPKADGLGALRRLLTLQCKRARLHVEVGQGGTRSIIELQDPPMA